MTEVVIGPSDTTRELARAVLIHGPISRSDLGRRLGLSAASLTRLSKPLLDRGLFVEGAEDYAGTVGRPARPLDVRVDARRFIGVKITGDEVLAVCTDLRATEIGTARRTLDSHSLDHVVARVRQVVAELGGTAGISGVGVCLGGNVTGGRMVTRAPFLGWRDVDLGSAVGSALGLPVTVENDVVALAAAEQWFGAGRGVQNFAVLTIGAGVGYGLVINDRVIVTPDAGLGLAGHIPLDATGPLCPDGHRGCSRAMLTSASLCAQVGIALGREVRYEEVLSLAEGGDAVARAVVSAAGRALGRLIALIANLAMLDTIVLSGEGVGLWRLVESEARREALRGRDADAAQLSVIVDDSGFSPWARGAAAVAIQGSLGWLSPTPA